MLLVPWVLQECLWSCGCCRDASGAMGIAGMPLVLWVLQGCLWSCECCRDASGSIGAAENAYGSMSASAFSFIVALKSQDKQGKSWA